MDPLPLDKLLHASVSANLVLGGAAIAHGLGASPWLATGIGTALAVTLGLLREVLGNRDPWDLLADGVGVMAGVGTTMLLTGVW